MFPEFFPTDETTSAGRHMEKRSTYRLLGDLAENITELSVTNMAAFNKALRRARPGMVVLVPDGKSYTFTGGILGQYLDGVTIDFAGSIHFVHDLQVCVDLDVKARA